MRPYMHFDCENYLYDNLEEIRNYLSTLSPLVQLKEVFQLNTALKNKRSFSITVGDCAELFSESKPSRVEAFIKLLYECEKIVKSCGNFTPVLLFRGAGQYGKSRTKQYDCDGRYNYFGDAINGPSSSERAPQIFNLYRAYLHSQHIRRLLYGLADKSSIYQTHEALLLQFEYAMSRRCQNELYSTSAHMLWLGIRTRSSYVSHADFLGNISNPVAIKIDSTFSVKYLSSLIKSLIRGERVIMLVVRAGRAKIRECLERLLSMELVEEQRDILSIVCDPMHGNTIKDNSVKIRRFSDVLEECRVFFEIFSKLRFRYSIGLHLESSASKRQECLSLTGVKGEESVCDPRLTYSETIHVLKEAIEKVK